MSDDQLWGAIHRGDVQFLRQYLAPETSLDDVDEDGRTALMCAILADLPEPTKLEIVEALLEHGAPVNHKDAAQAWTALAFAVRDCSPAICSRLIAAGANIEATDVFGNTPLWRATMEGRQDNVRLLLAHGASPDRKNKQEVSARDVATRLRRDYFDRT
jgi:uncharacterized protein